MLKILSFVSGIFRDPYNLTADWQVIDILIFMSDDLIGSEIQGIGGSESSVFTKPMALPTIEQASASNSSS